MEKILNELHCIFPPNIYKIEKNNEKIIVTDVIFEKEYNELLKILEEN